MYDTKFGRAIYNSTSYTNDLADEREGTLMKTAARVRSKPAAARSVQDARAPPLAASLACTPLNLTRAVCTEREPGRGGRRRRGDTRPTAGEVRRDARKANPSGLDIRTCMLVERLLAPTPLRGLWTGDGACVPPARVFSRASLSFFSREPSP